MYRAIVVDDEEVIRNGVSRQLESLNLSIKVVAKARDGEEALKLFFEHTPDIVLMDINIPRINGLECIRRIREVNQTCVVIIVSGYDDFEYARTAIRHNVDFYLLKPVDDEEFEGIIRQAVTRYNERMEVKSILTKHTPVQQKQKTSIVEFINTHYTQKDLTSETLEKEFNLSRTALFHQLKKLTNMSFNEYVTGLRINHAIRLLKEDKTIGEIAECIGYSDQYYFSRIFKKKTGLSPSEYREQQERTHTS